MQDDKIITVFGGSGFVGQAIVQKLLQRGYRVRVAVRHPERAGDLLTAGNVGQVAVVGCDIKNPDHIKSVVQGAWGVINCVGILYQSGKQKFHTVQGVAAEHIAKFAAKAGVQRLVHLSAIGANTNSPSKYAISKALGEKGVLKRFPQAVILRPSIVFGAGDSFFNLFAAMAASPAPFIPLVGANTRFQPVYVGDVADACICALETADCQGKTYELGGPDVATFEALLDLIGEYTGRRMRYLRIPFGMAKVVGFFGGFLPTPPITLDQVRLLQKDNIVSEGALGLEDLGVSATSVHGILPSYMDIYTESGRYSSYRETI